MLSSLASIHLLGNASHLYNINQTYQLANPNNRYTNDYTFQIAIFYGDTKTNFESYLRPIIRSLDQLSKQPLVVKRNGEHIATSNVFCFGVIADGVEINQRLLMFGGHTGFHGCRFCLGMC